MKSQNEVVKEYENEFYLNDEPYYIHYELTWHCYMDGIGRYECHGYIGNDIGKFCADLLDINITKVYEFEGNEIQISDEVRKQLEDIIAKYAEFGDD